MLEDLLENPPDETPGWHASELETSQVMAHNDSLVRLDRAADDRAQVPKWLPQSFIKQDGAPDVALQGLPLLRVPDGPQRVRENRYHGVLRLMLREGAYDWEFVTAPKGTVAGSGTSSCH